MRLAAIALVLFACVADAAADNFAQRVAKVKAGLLADADAAFVEVWPSFPKEAADLGVTAAGTRAWARWIVIGQDLGVCRNYAPNSLIADWYSAFDQIDLPFSLRGALRKKGDEAREKGGNSLALAKLTDAERLEFCKIELEAVRQVLAEKQ